MDGGCKNMYTLEHGISTTHWSGDLLPTSKKSCCYKELGNAFKAKFIVRCMWRHYKISGKWISKPK